MSALHKIKTHPAQPTSAVPAGMPADKGLPFLIWLVLVSTVLALIGNISILGYHLTGWGWFIPFVFSIIVILINPTRVKFPVFVWLPWMIVILLYGAFSDFPSVQRTAQLICPMVIGMAVSTYRFQPVQLIKFKKSLKYLTGALFLTVLVKSGIPMTGQLPEITGLAAEVMTGMLLCTVYAAAYAEGDGKAIFMWASLSVVPFVALTRTAIVATGLTLPFTFGSLDLRKRILMMLFLCLLGVALFFTPRVQKKMFYSGSGEMSDVLSDDFRNTGRFHMWEQMKTGIDESPLFGHGTGAGEVFTRKVTMGSSGYPHNDWLLTLYDLGIFGTVTFFLSILTAAFHAFRRSRLVSGEERLLFLAGAASFIPFAMLMYTDNIMVYASFFGDLQFAILGVAYASLYKPVSKRGLRIRW